MLFLQIHKKSDMFKVIYRFKVHPGKTENFIQAWEELTKLIYIYEGSLASILHQESNSVYLAYASWADHKSCKNSGDKLPPEAEKWQEQMRDGCKSIKTLHTMEMVSDLSNQKVINS